MASPEIRTYQASLDTVFAAGQRAIRDLGYKIDSIDRQSGLLNFKTGMSWSSWAGQDMSAMFVDNADGTIEVSVTGRRNPNGVVLQVYDWGEAKTIAAKLLAAIDGQVQNAPSSPVPTAPAPPAPLGQTGPSIVREERECPFCAEVILKKARVCKHCGRDLSESQPTQQPPADAVTGFADQPAPVAIHSPTILPKPSSIPPSSLNQRPLHAQQSDEEFFESIGVGNPTIEQTLDSPSKREKQAGVADNARPGEISVFCACGAHLKAKPSLIGKTVRCPKCSQPLKIRN